MSFTPANMNTFSRRCQNIANAIQNIREEGSRLRAIYQNETGSGTDPDWGDTTIATASEHVDLGTFLGELEDFLTGQAVSATNRVPVLTPFLQNE